jgi:hypothetical protein
MPATAARPRRVCKHTLDSRAAPPRTQAAALIVLSETHDHEDYACCSGCARVPQRSGIGALAAVVGCGYTGCFRWIGEKRRQEHGDMQANREIKEAK